MVYLKTGIFFLGIFLLTQGGEAVLKEENPNIRVLIIDSVNSIILIPGSAWHAKNPDDRDTISLPENQETAISFVEKRILLGNARGSL